MPNSAIVMPKDARGHGTVCPGPAALVGNTPLLRIQAASAGYWAKLEGHNPGGIKDRAALHMVQSALGKGLLSAGAPIVESTSGTLGLGLALAGLVHKHPVTVVTDPGMEPLMRHMLAAYGANVELVSTPHPTGGWQEARRERVAELLKETPHAWSPNQYDNPDNVSAYASLAHELAEQLPQIDILVCAVGTGGHSAGIYRTLRQRFPALRLAGVDTIGSTIFGQPARPRLMRGLGSSIHPRNVDYAAFSEVHWVPPAAAVSSARQLAHSYYETGGWSVGAVALVADWLARTNPAGTNIVAIFPDGPQRYADTVFNDAYCAQHELLLSELPDSPEIMGHPSEREVTRWTRCTHVIDPRALSGVSA
ncbi:MAG: cysteine synthase family protein [Corynebacteriales bacterium]|nr:cysteine synthase family protein [Mycobacteriales bacterium]